MERYYIAETSGDLEPNQRATRASLEPAASVMVLDRLLCHRLVANFRAEDFGSRNRGWAERNAHARTAAAQLAASLNA